MCGIAGILQPWDEHSAQVLSRMGVSLQHRGPDDQGQWVDAAAGIGLAHRRLSIVDLSPSGAQPMVSADGRYVLCYNGEIYNHEALRAELNGASPMVWRGHSDTEVLLAAIQHWGLAATLARANGMFAFALWDRQARTLTLVRDPMGEKPLYVGFLGQAIVFASELKALGQHPAWAPRIDRAALGLLLRYGYVPAPGSIYQGVFKLPAGALITLSLGDLGRAWGQQDFVARRETYWSLDETVKSGQAQGFQGSASELQEELDRLLNDAVRIRMAADVPVGAMLSGGVDSSLIAAVMQRNSPVPINTFTVGFADPRYNEAYHARKVAAHIGSHHTEVQLSPADALAIVPLMSRVYDEPFADVSQLPTYLVSGVARQHVTVALSGDGGDELFCGYGRYRDALYWWAKFGQLPAGARALVARAAGLSALMPAGGGGLGFKIRRLAQRLDAPDFDGYYGNLASLNLIPTSSPWPQSWGHSPLLAPDVLASSTPQQRMRYMDQKLYLPEDILAKVDRASMAHSLELRVPLLDPRLVCFAWRLPDEALFRHPKGKLPLRDLLYQYVPQALVDRPKKGFDVPLGDWLRGPLRAWMMDLLAPVLAGQCDYFNVSTLKMLVEEHLAGRGDHALALWPVLMFRAWENEWR